MDGILVINKPAGMTSHDVISHLRRQYKQKKFGHTGTLDPDATGVLVVLAGKACKCLQFLENTDKEYVAEIELGTDTDTDDASGNAVDSAPVHTDFDFALELQKFVGPQHQRVPRTSAKKVDGRKLYELQRKGREVPDVYTDVTIYQAEPLDDSVFKFRVACSSGTYIRSICRDLAHNTGNCGHMKSLVRTRAGQFTLDQAQPLEGPHTVYPVRMALQGLPALHWSGAGDIENGRRIHMDSTEDMVLMVDEQGEPMAVYGRDHGDVFGCVRGLR